MAAAMKPISIEVWNPNGKYRIVSTKSMPGSRWIRLLTDQDCRVEAIISRFSPSYLFFSGTQYFLRVQRHFSLVSLDMHGEENYSFGG